MHEWSERKGVKEFKEAILIDMLEAQGSFWAKRRWYLLASFVGMSAFIRTKFMNETKCAKMTIIK